MPDVVKGLYLWNGSVVEAHAGRVELGDLARAPGGTILGRSRYGAGDLEHVAVGDRLTIAGGTLSADEQIDYAEGTWTPSFGGTDSSAVPIGSSVAYAGRYTKVGRVVYFQVEISTTGAATTAGVAGTTACGLPLPAAANGVCVGADLTTRVGLGTGAVDAASDTLYPPGWPATGNTIVITGQYETH